MINSTAVTRINEAMKLLQEAQLALGFIRLNQSEDMDRLINAIENLDDVILDLESIVNVNPFK